MTMAEAKVAISQGKKITHRYFEEHEFVQEKNGFIVGHDTFIHRDFWGSRISHGWRDGWELFNENKTV